LPPLDPQGQPRGGLELLVYLQQERRTFPLPPEGTVTVGRSIENDVRIEQRSISRRHLQLHVTPRGLEIEDLESANGTFLLGEREASCLDEAAIHGSGQRLSPKRRVPLSCGALVRMGTVLFVVHRPHPTTHHEALRGSPALGGAAIVVDPKVRRIYELGIRAAQSDITVLILGETGVGKEVLAETIHAHSRRAGRPFLRLNCAALSETLLESELFGHEKGAFTGATSAKVGLLEATEGGTVFLDEIGELPLSTQVKLLRVLEDRAVRRVGSTRARRIDVRFVTATNRDLRRQVARGRFREDLYFRINGVKLEIPPLRERPSEVEPLARFFLHEFCVRCNIPEPRLSPEAIEQLRQYSWPGNVRELRNVMERAPFLVGEGSIRPEHVPRNDRPSLSPALLDAEEGDLPTDLHPVSVPLPPAPRAPAPGLPEPLQDAPSGGDRHAERARVQRALEACGGNQTRAARLLGISRRTLVNRLDEFQLPRPKKRP